MAFTTAQLDAINGAIASGELTIEYDGKRVTYRSMGELMQARAVIMSELNAAAGTATPTSALAEFSRD